jgi:hypothetical protein
MGASGGHLDDLLKVPEHLVAEILDGSFMPLRPAPRHADASSGLGGACVGPSIAAGAGQRLAILDEPKLLSIEISSCRISAGGGGNGCPNCRRRFSVARLGLRSALAIHGGDGSREELTIYARNVSHAWFVDQSPNPQCCDWRRPVDDCVDVVWC